MVQNHSLGFSDTIVYNSHLLVPDKRFQYVINSILAYIKKCKYNTITAFMEDLKYMLSQQNRRVPSGKRILAEFFNDAINNKSLDYYYKNIDGNYDVILSIRDLFPLKFWKDADRRIGRFIVFEGTDAIGKDTWINELKTELADKVVFTREPGGVAVSEKIRQLLLEPDNTMCPDTEMLLFFAARTEFVSNVLVPLIESGTTVLSSRYIYSSYVYQCIVRNASSRLFHSLKDSIFCGNHSVYVTPSLLILAYVDNIDVIKSRLGNRDEKDRIEQFGIEFLDKTNNAYKDLTDTKNCMILNPNPSKVSYFGKGKYRDVTHKSSRYPTPLLPLNCSGTLEEVRKLVMDKDNEHSIVSRILYML